jgi:hypothetical protein
MILWLINSLHIMSLNGKESPVLDCFTGEQRNYWLGQKPLIKAALTLRGQQ